MGEMGMSMYARCSVTSGGLHPPDRWGPPGPQPYRKAVQRTVPLRLVCVSLVVVWYVHHGQPVLDLAVRHARAPWYRHNHAVLFADMHAALRRAIIAAQYRPGHLLTPSQKKLQARLPWPSPPRKVRNPKVAGDGTLVRSPCAGPTSTSEQIPPIVRVIGAQVAGHRDQHRDGRITGQDADRPTARRRPRLAQ
jgi:hypothetical protein